MGKMTSFGARLAEERRRMGLKQAEFAALVGTDVPKQSLYEHGHRQLRGAYLARLSAAGVDILYVLTGKRREGHDLGEQPAAMLTAFIALPPGLQDAVIRLAEDLRRHSEKGTGRAGGEGN